MKKKQTLDEYYKQAEREYEWMEKWLFPPLFAVVAFGIALLFYVAWSQ